MSTTSTEDATPTPGGADRAPGQGARGSLPARWPQARAAPQLGPRARGPGSGQDVGPRDRSGRRRPPRRRGEVLGIIGDNGAGKSTLIKCLTGALIPDRGEILLEGKTVSFKSPTEAGGRDRDRLPDAGGGSGARHASNMFLGREIRRKGPLGTIFRALDVRGMRTAGSRAADQARDHHRPGHHPAARDALGRPAPSGGGGPGGGVRDQGHRARRADGRPRRQGGQHGARADQGAAQPGIPVILISHNMPHVFEVADRVHIQRLGAAPAWSGRTRPRWRDAVAIMTGAKQIETPAG